MSARWATGKMDVDENKNKCAYKNGRRCRMAIELRRTHQTNSCLSLTTPRLNTMDV